MKAIKDSRPAKAKAEDILLAGDNHDVAAVCEESMAAAIFFRRVFSVVSLSVFESEGCS
jgi:hypothetical protein